MATTDTVTLLFTSFTDQGDLLGQQERTLTRQIQVFEKLVNEAVATCGGREAQWLGDGVMAVFRSAGDAVRCAIAVQQSGRRATAAWRGSIRVGLHVGETPSGRSAYGVPLLTSRKLCERAAAGQILCSKLIAGLLPERRDFKFSDLPELESHGAPPFAVCEVTYERADPAVLLRHTPFVGRADELSKLENALTQARTSHGGAVMLIGEPGIARPA
jgi:class 3 adenylate cyclase